MTYTLTYVLINNETAYEVSGYTGEPVDIVISSSYNGKPVTSLGEGAFYSCSGLTSVVIPDSVTSIGDGAFYGCSSLTSITIPNGVTSIGNDAFSGCTSLTSVVIGDSVTSIGYNAFTLCSSLTSIEIPDSVTSIGFGAFDNCTSLTSVVLGNSVTSIDSYAFYYCESLTSIEIPDSVTSISDYAFESCSSLIKVTLLAKTPPSLHGANVFSSNPTFYCFNGAIEAYKTASNWNAYANKFVADDMRLYFTMNSRAQKKYFASKEWINEQSFGTAIQIITWEEND